MPQSADQFSGIFISYRRDDSVGHAGRLYDHLTARFGDRQVFMDVDQIEPGEDFVRVIEDAVGSCEVLLAVMGRGWLESSDEEGRRLDNSNDFVRLEIAAALTRGIHVIPILVQGARIPRSQDLPEDLHPLLRRNAVELSDLRWRRDVDQLIVALERIIARQRAARLAAQKAEEERRSREAEAQRRQDAAEKRLALVAAERERREAEALPQEDEGVARQPVVTIPPGDDLNPVREDYSAFRKFSASLRPSFVGGVFAGVPSGIPFVNLLCMIWAICGGILAVHSYSRRAKAGLSSRDGVRLGLMTGLTGSMLALPIGMSLEYLLKNWFPGLNNDAAAVTGLSHFILILVRIVSNVVFIIGFSVIGGMIGISVFKRREGARK